MLASDVGNREGTHRLRIYIFTHHAPEDYSEVITRVVPQPQWCVGVP